MPKLTSRLRAFYEGVMREDMLTLFNRVVRLKEVECSIVLNGAINSNNETRYRAAALLELLTGQMAQGEDCNVPFEDPFIRLRTEQQKQMAERAKAELMRSKMSNITESIIAAKKKLSETDKLQIGKDMKRLGVGLRLHTTLGPSKFWDFLERIREHHLPDIVEENVDNDGDDNATITSTVNTTNTKTDSILHFQKKGGSIKPQYPRHFPVNSKENPGEALTCYTIDSTEFLKFPDIEVHFEALAPILTRDGVDGSLSEPIRLLIRPLLQIDSTSLNKEERAELLQHQGRIDNLEVMNYFLRQIFNPFLNRPAIGIPIPLKNK